MVRIGAMIIIMVASTMMTPSGIMMAIRRKWLLELAAASLETDASNHCDCVLASCGSKNWFKFTRTQG